MNKHILQHSKGIILAFISTLLGASITIMYKPLMNQGVAALTISFIESIAIVFCLLLVSKPWRLLRANKRIIHTIAICSACQAVGNTCFYLGLSYLDPVTFSFLTRNQAVFSVIFGFCLLGERHDLLTWLFIALAIIGSVLLCYADISPVNLMGIVFAISFCFLFGIRNFMLRKYPLTPVLPNIFCGYLLSMVLLSFLINFDNYQEFANIDLPMVMRICAIAIVASFGTLYTFQLALRYDSVSIISSIRLFSPFIVAIYFGWQLGFHYAPAKSLGLTIMSLAILTLVYSSRRKYRAQRLQPQVI